MSGLVVDRPASGVLRLRLNRPRRRNALDPALVAALHVAFTDPDARVVVLSSTDAAAFCAGADLNIPDGERARMSDDLYALYERMVSLPIPIVVAVGGRAVGGGAQLALAGDIRLGNQATSIRFLGPGHGLAVGAWGLPSLVGRGRTMDLCLTMRTVPAREALAIGLLDRVVDDPDRAAIELAAALATLDRAAVVRVKSLVRSSANLLELLREEREGNLGWSGEIGGEV